jgi:NADH-quinone oxidoreductase subunit L
MTLPQLGLVVALAPLLAAVVVGLWGPKLGRRASHRICILGVALATVVSFVVWRDVIGAGASFNGDLYTWFAMDGFKLTIGFLIDPLTATMMLVVTFVSLMVHIYTIGYMDDDRATPGSSATSRCSRSAC